MNKRLTMAALIETLIHSGPFSWARLAPALAPTNPEAALHAYRHVCGAHIAETRNQGYSNAIAVLRVMRPLHQQTGTTDAFMSYLDDLRSQHRAKRNFIAYLDEFSRAWA